MGGYVLINHEKMRLEERPDMTQAQAEEFNRIFKLFGDSARWVREWRRDGRK